jgi:transcriptional regulatory protein RtcR
VSAEAAWAANFRDFNAAFVRMATLAPGGRITTAIVDDEIARLRASWTPPQTGAEALVERLVAADTMTRLDRFERIQLEDVLLVCVRSHSLSEAGRILFSASRARRTTANDADRLRKYLARFGLSWGDVQAAR